MSKQDELILVRRALAEVQSGSEVRLFLQFNFQRDPASGRREWDSIEVPVAARVDLIRSLSTREKSLCREIAADLRRQADELEKP